MSSGFKEKTFDLHREELLRASNETQFIVFLCGPSIKGVLANPDKRGHDPAAVLRAKIKSDLEDNGFDVVLGEDDGLDDPRIEVGLNAQDNELEYISKHCHAVVVVAGKTAIGAFCELGLFSWHFTHPNGSIKNDGQDKDFILLVDRQFEKHKSYFNEGPAAVVDVFGKTEFIDYGSYDVTEITKRLKHRKAMIGKEGRDRRGSSP